MEKLKTFLESQRFQYGIITVIVINAVVLGMQTSDGLMVQGSSMRLTRPHW